MAELLSTTHQQPYQVSANAGQYLDESEAALQRLSTDVAKTVVSNILEQF